MVFKNRGHFCNYCRKILFNKLVGIAPAQGFTGIKGIDNHVLWHVWDSQDDSLKEQFIKDLTDLQFADGSKVGSINLQLRQLQNKYLDAKGFSNADFRPEKSLQQVIK